MFARITQELADQAVTWAKTNPGAEMVGLFFFPVFNQVPRFVQLPNRHPSPLTEWKIDYEDIEANILDMYRDVPGPGEFATFHTHPVGVGKPSRTDHEAAELLAKSMDGHPFWQPCARHLIYAVEDGSWWWYDMIECGQVGWEWPNEY